MSKQTLVLKRFSTGISAAAALTMIYGCASQQPAPLFTQAQRTYAQASEGKAGEFAPDELLEAKTLLDKAEHSKNGSELQIHYSYLADRQARLATSSADIEFYQKQAKDAETQYITGLEQRSASSDKELEETKSELADIETAMQAKDANVTELEARKAELEQRRAQLESKLAEKDAALSASEQARKSAEAQTAAALASLKELAQVKEEANETVITLSGSVLFKTGEAKLLPIAETNLAKVATAIKQMNDGNQIVIEGHTDSQGTTNSNDKLSQERAQSVLDYLAKEGVDRSRMKAVGKGESTPVANNESPEGRANNRRVELHISGGNSDSKSAQSKPGETASPS